MKRIGLIWLATILSVGCGSSGDSGSDGGTTVPPIVLDLPDTSPAKIKINQIGYFTNRSKMGIAPAVTASSFNIVNVENGNIAYSGFLGNASSWEPAGTDLFKQVDFSEFMTPGSYRIEIEGLQPSDSFAIANGVYDSLQDAALKAFYYNRSSTRLEATYAGNYPRAAGHLDTDVLIHASAATALRPEGSSFSSAKGWYDAGDYGKYTVNSGISTYTLLAAYEHHPAQYINQNLNIPESSNTVPDILDEAMWNLEWLQSMQDPNDGGVYHKLTTLNFSGQIIPAAGAGQRYFIGKSTAATLDFAALMAVASRIYADYEIAFPGKAASFRLAAIDAWNWAVDNPEVTYNQPFDVSTGAYDDDNLSDEFSWASAELYLLTEETKYLNNFNDQNPYLSSPDWRNVTALGYISLANKGKTLLSSEEYTEVTMALVANADTLLQRYQTADQWVPMSNEDFRWGSNSVALNNAWLLLEANKINSNESYVTAATAAVDYVLGKNPTDYSFVTGFGHQTPLNIHHRTSFADGIIDPVPGFIVGGPHAGRQDTCVYPSNNPDPEKTYMDDWYDPAKTYLDDWCSYSTNEVAINWNAVLVYVLGAISALD
jgi:endoglucanase